MSSHWRVKMPVERWRNEISSIISSLAPIVGYFSWRRVPCIACLSANVIEIRLVVLYPDSSGIFSSPRMLLTRDSLHLRSVERIARRAAHNAGMVVHEQLNRAASGPDESGKHDKSDLYGMNVRRGKISATHQMGKSYLRLECASSLPLLSLIADITGNPTYTSRW